MKILIAEDEIIQKRLLLKYLESYGSLRWVDDGEDALYEFVVAWKDNAPYDLICLDLMMPRLNGQEVLKHIREMEKEMGVKVEQEAKILVITMLDDLKSIIEAYYQGGATAYIVKPIDRGKIVNEIIKMGLIK